MAIDFQNPLTAGTVLVRSDIRSQNYVPGVSGWIIEADGDAEFNNLTIRGEFVGTTFVINSLGAFFYDGAPAAGNLIASIASLSGTDSFGNVYLSGVVSYAGDVFASLDVGNLLLGLVSDSTRAGFVGLVGGDGVAGMSPFSVSRPDTASWQLEDGDNTVTPQSSANFPHIQLDGTVWTKRPVVSATNPGNVWAAETWHNPTFSGTWSTTGTLNGNATFQGLQYRKDAEDNVWISGGATTTGAGASVFTLPAGYFHTTRRHLVPCWIFDASAAAVTAAFAQVTETGVVSLAATLTGVTIAAGDQVYINGKFPLGNVS